MGQFWEKLLFWKQPQMKSPIENEDYELVDFKDSNITGVEILKGKYKGIIYHYTGSRVIQEEPLPRLQFAYVIVDSGNYTHEGLENDDGFVTLLGNILTDILTNEANYNESFRALNSKESYPQ